MAMFDYNHCPRCKSDDVKFHKTYSDDLSFPSAWIQKRVCLVCGFRWKAIYHFAYHRNMDGNEIDGDGEEKE